MQDEEQNKATLALLTGLAVQLENYGKQQQEAGRRLVEAANSIAGKMEIGSGLISQQVAQLTRNLSAGFEAIAANVPQPTAFATLGRTGGVELAMEITGRTKQTIYNLVAEGKLPATKNGGRLHFSETALRAYTMTPRASSILPSPLTPFNPSVYIPGFMPVPPAGISIVDQIAAKVVEKLNNPDSTNGE